MWLLDVNLPHGLIQVLLDKGVACETTIARGWRDLDNGVLAKAASEAGFTVILTRDKLFGESASRALKNYPKLSIVVLKLPQSRELTYLTQFEKYWKLFPIVPKIGATIHWPPSF